MAIQDELSNAAKDVILTTIQQSLVVFNVSCSESVSDELFDCEYVTRTNSIIRLTDTAIEEILDILRMDFYN